jgi:hypothetical protein
MSVHCPRCDVSFEKDLARCPGCGWDFRAHVIPDGFLKPPLDLSPIKDLGRFLLKDFPLVWINGITVEAIWGFVAYIFFRVSLFAAAFLEPEKAGAPLDIYMAVLSLVLSLILVMPIWATYLFGLLRRYRYHVPVAFFNVFVPGRSRYVQTMVFGLPCFLAGAVLLALIIVPGVTCLWIFVPFLLLMHLDKRSISNRRKAFILELTFRRLWSLILFSGLILSALWVIAGALVLSWFWVGIVVTMLIIPPQAAFGMLLYETLLGRENLDVDN